MKITKEMIEAFIGSDQNDLDYQNIIVTLIVF